jgi:replicative DNA helicase
LRSLVADSSRLIEHTGIKLFVIDYLQLLLSTSRRAESRQQEIADISNGIKALAKELKVPIRAYTRFESAAKVSADDLPE